MKKNVKSFTAQILVINKVKKFYSSNIVVN